MIYFQCLVKILLFDNFIERRGKMFFTLQGLFLGIENGQFKSDAVLKVLALKDLKEIISLELEIAGKLEYLVNCQKSGDSAVRNVSRELALNVDKERLAENLEYLVNCQKSGDSAVRDVSRELALKVDKELMAELMAEEMNKVKKFISS